MSMLMGTRSYKLLEGVRGEAGVNLSAIGEALQRISQLVTDFPQIAELDINPFIVGKLGRGLGGGGRANPAGRGRCAMSEQAQARLRRRLAEQVRQHGHDRRAGGREDQARAEGLHRQRRGAAPAPGAGAGRAARGVGRHSGPLVSDAGRGSLRFQGTRRPLLGEHLLRVGEREEHDPGGLRGLHPHLPVRHPGALRQRGDAHRRRPDPGDAAGPCRAGAAWASRSTSSSRRPPTPAW